MTIKPGVSFRFNFLATVFASIFIFGFINFYSNTLKSIAISSLVSYLMFFTSWFINYKVRLNYYSLFLVFTYLFFFGQFFLMLIGVPMESGRTILDELIPVPMLVKTGKLILNSMLLLHLGVLLSTRNINKEMEKCNFKYASDSNSLKYIESLKAVSLILLLISIIPSLIVLYNNVIITLTQGYGAIFNSEQYVSGGFDNILRFISLFTIPSLLMLLIAFKGTNKLKYINLVLFIYLALYFMSGSRLNGVIFLSTLLLVRHFWYKPIKYKEGMRLLLILLLLLTILSTISEVRNALYVSNNIDFLIKETFVGVIQKNPIFAAMEETGYTFLAIAAVVTYCPLVVPFQYGVSYLNSLAMIFPNLFWDVHPAALTNTDKVFQGFLTQYGGIGSSFIAESYWNFGYWSLFLAFIYGLLIGFLTKRIAWYAHCKNSRMFYLMIYIAQISLLYVRSDTISFWRNFLYFGILPILLTDSLYSIITEKQKK